MKSAKEKDPLISLQQIYVSLIINKDYFAIDEAVNDISQLINEVLALK